MASEIRVSYEAVRQQVAAMRSEGWLERSVPRPESSGVGRPRAAYRLTAAGEHCFPKHYDFLSVALIDGILARSGPEGLREILADLADAKSREWEPRLEGLTLEEKLESLRDLYLPADPYTSVEKNGDGDLRLVERNCPFYNVARQRPALCSLSVSTLERLLGYRVEREERFQAGHGRCVFRVRTDRPLAEAPFRFEDRG